MYPDKILDGRSQRPKRPTLNTRQPAGQRPLSALLSNVTRNDHTPTRLAGFSGRRLAGTTLATALVVALSACTAGPVPEAVDGPPTAKQQVGTTASTNAELPESIVEGHDPNLVKFLTYSKQRVQEVQVPTGRNIVRANVMVVGGSGAGTSGTRGSEVADVMLEGLFHVPAFWSWFGDPAETDPGIGKSGRGAAVGGSFAVTPGETLKIAVGGAGQDQDGNKSPGAGGWGTTDKFTGGKGGSGRGTSQDGAGGGGASVVMRKSGDPLVVAGGGGGASGKVAVTINSGGFSGGDGGLDEGKPGFAEGVQPAVGGSLGHPSNDSRGGSAGQGGITVPAGGGGGGGGYYPGVGGRAYYADGGGGGGGGSSYTSPDVSGVWSMTNNYKLDGQVIIQFVTADPVITLGATAVGGAPLLLESNGSNNSDARHGQNGSVVDMWTQPAEGPTANQQWRYHPKPGSDTGWLINQDTGRCLEMNGTTFKLDQWDCGKSTLLTDGGNQLWTLKEDGAGSVTLSLPFVAKEKEEGKYDWETKDKIDQRLRLADTWPVNGGRLEVSAGKNPGATFKITVVDPDKPGGEHNFFGNGTQWAIGSSGAPDQLLRRGDTNSDGGGLVEMSKRSNATDDDQQPAKDFTWIWKQTDSGYGHLVSMVDNTCLRGDGTSEDMDTTTCGGESPAQKAASANQEWRAVWDEAAGGVRLHNRHDDTYLTTASGAPDGSKVTTGADKVPTSMWVITPAG